jgi:hypothetical protein
MTKQVTINELFEAVSAFSESVDKQFSDTKEDIRAIRAEMATKEEIKAIRAEMATKEDLRGYATKDDLRQEVGKVISLFSPMVYKADRKVNSLMERLVSKRVLTRSDVKDLMDMHPLAP